MKILEKLEQFFTPLILTLVLVLVVLTFAIFNEFIATRYIDLEYANSLTSDGPLQTQRLLEMLEANSVHPRGFYNYGNLHHILSFWLAKVFLVIGYPLSYSLAALSLALIQWIAALATGFLTFAFLRKFSLPLTASALIAVVLVLGPSGLFGWIHQLHPDIVQIPFLLSVLIVIYKLSVPRLIIASFFIGLATGIKYIGAIYGIIIPVAWGLMVAQRHSGFEARALFREIPFTVNLGIACLLSFSLGFFIFNHTVLIHFDLFFNDFIYEMGHVSYGDGRLESANGFEWIPLLYSQLSFLWAIPLVLPVVTLLTKFLGSGNLSIRKRHFIIILTFLTIAILLHLFFSVNMRRFRYAFHYLPVLTCSLAIMLSLTPKNIQRKLSYIFAIITVALFLPSISTSYTRVGAEIQYAKFGERLAIGNALASSCKNDAVAIVPQYSYLPATFSNRLKGYVYSTKDLNLADFFVLNSSVPGRFVWTTKERYLSSKDPIFYETFDQAKSQFETFLPVFKGSTHQLIYLSGDIIVGINKMSSSCNASSFNSEIISKYSIYSDNLLK